LVARSLRSLGIVGKVQTGRLARVIGDALPATPDQRALWRSFLRSRAWSVVVAGLGRAAAWVVSIAEGEAGPTRVKSPAVGTPGALRADLVPALCRGLLRERQRAVSDTWRVRWRGRGALLEGVLSPDGDDLVWAPSPYWRYHSAAELLIQGRVRASLVRAYFVTALVIEARGGTAWFVVPRRTVR
jgi:hypothetical protein